MIARLLLTLVAILVAGTAYAETWRGLTVAPEHRCTPYVRTAYPYSQKVERQIVERAGYLVDAEGRLNKPFPSPYAPDVVFTYIKGRTGTDIEHIVSLSEAHDSGLCDADEETKRRFASDLDNLTLASAYVNRYQKSGHDAAEWMPEINQTWYATTVVQVKRKYGLTVDPAERDALAQALIPMQAIPQQAAIETQPPPVRTAETILAEIDALMQELKTVLNP